MDIKKVEALNKEIEEIMRQRTKAEARRQVFQNNLKEKIAKYKEAYGVDLSGADMKSTADIIQKEYDAVNAAFESEYKLAEQVVAKIKAGDIQGARILLGENPVSEVEATMVQGEESDSVEDQEMPVLEEKGIDEPKAPVAEQKPVVPQQPKVQEAPTGSMKDVFANDEEESIAVKMSSAPNLGSFSIDDEEDDDGAPSGGSFIDDDEDDDEPDFGFAPVKDEPKEETKVASAQKPASAAPKAPSTGFGFLDDDDDDDDTFGFKDLLKGSQFDV